jgi:hypothetical protein
MSSVTGLDDLIQNLLVMIETEVVGNSSARAAATEELTHQ